MRYYPDLKLFSWLRKRLGIQKPYALEWGGWEKWENEVKKQRPVAFWFTETLPSAIQDAVEAVVNPVNEIKYHMRNRWVTQTHALVSDLPRGKWYDMDTRILYCLFTELVNFVEIEKAHLHVAVCGDDQQRKQYQMPWWRRYHWLRWSQWRCAQAGVDYLNWEQTLVLNQSYGVNPGDPKWGKPTPQALNAREILELYQWWTVTRPNRPEPEDASGWTEYYNTHCCDANGNPQWGHSSSKQRQLLRRTQRIERQYDREDEQMMIRLIKVRRSMWT